MSDENPRCVILMDLTIFMNSSVFIIISTVYQALCTRRVIDILNHFV